MLTETKARKIKVGDKPVADGTITGLRLLPSTANGRGKWQLRFVSPVTNKRRDMGIGHFPIVGIAEARELAFEARKVIAAGLDPIIQRQQKKEQIAQCVKVPSFEVAAKIVHEEHKAGWSNGKHVDQWINTMVSYVFPLIGKLEVDILKPSDFADVLRPIWLSKPETARRVKQRCHTIMKWCWGKQFTQGNPLDMVDMLLPKQSASARVSVHHPAMPWRIVPDFVKNKIHSGNDVTRHLLEFTILTAARSGEARGVKWEEIDFTTATWSVPADRMKTKTAHRVPLSCRAIELLEERRELACHLDLVFPSPRGKMLSDMAMTKFLRTHKAESDTPGRIATTHGFRSAFRNWASETGVPRDVAERSLAHLIQNKVEAAYHRTDLLEQRRPVMEAWGTLVTGAQSL